MTDVQMRLVTFTEAVLLRPAMYTVNGTFGEAVSFLEGYYSGWPRGSGDLPPGVAEWSTFRSWLAAHLGVDGTYVFEQIQQSYDDDCQRLSALIGLFARYLAER